MNKKGIKAVKKEINEIETTKVIQMNKITIISYMVVLLGWVALNEGCGTTPEPRSNFKYSKEMIAGNFTLFYNDVLNGKIKAQIRTPSVFNTIVLTVVDFNNSNLTNAFQVVSGENTFALSIVGGFEYVSFTKSVTSVIVDFNFIICNSMNSKYFGSDLRFLPSLTNSGETSNIIQDQTLASLIVQAKC